MARSNFAAFTSVLDVIGDCTLAEAVLNLHVWYTNRIA